MSHGIAALLLMHLASHFPVLSHLPQFGKPTMLSNKEVAESTTPYPEEFLKRKLNTPGMAEISIRFQVSPNLFIPSSRREDGSDSTLLPLLERIEDFVWEVLHDLPHAYIEMGRTRGEIIETPSGTKSAVSNVDFSNPWRSGFSWRWQSSMTFECDIGKTRKVRKYEESLPPDGKKNKSPCLEGILPIEMSGEGMCRLELAFGPWKIFQHERIRKPFHETVTVTLRSCRTKNWYSARIKFANRVGRFGPPWVD